jgi:hypothetical protein
MWKSQSLPQLGTPPLISIHGSKAKEQTNGVKKSETPESKTV